MINKVIDVENVTVRTEILDIKFFCDLDKCKGACCTIESAYGAPLLEEDIEEINSVLDIILEYLDPIKVKEIQTNGFYEVKDGELLTRSIDDKDCVFVYYENKIAKCAIEKAFYDGKVKYKKPISCHLFPIRISKFGGDILRYEEFFECEPALKLGKSKNVSIAEFCKDSLIRKYGEKWYTVLLEKKGL